MKIKGNNSNFEACPEFTGKAVCVDVTPLRKQQSQFGERDVFKLVLEVDLLKPDGAPYCVWSHNFTPSLNEKANFRKFLRAWFGRDLMESEMAKLVHLEEMLHLAHHPQNRRGFPVPHRFL